MSLLTEAIDRFRSLDEVVVGGMSSWLGRKVAPDELIAKRNRPWGQRGQAAPTEIQRPRVDPNATTQAPPPPKPKSVRIDPFHGASVAAPAKPAQPIDPFYGAPAHPSASTQSAVHGPRFGSSDIKPPRGMSSGQTAILPSFSGATSASQPSSHTGATTEPPPGAATPPAERTFSTRFQPGSLQHSVHLFRQAKELSRLTGREAHVVQMGQKRYITDLPKATLARTRPHHQVLGTYTSGQWGQVASSLDSVIGLRAALNAFRTIMEATLSMSVGPTLMGRKSLAAVECERKRRKKNPNKWDLPVAIGGIALVKRSGPLG